MASQRTSLGGLVAVVAAIAVVVAGCGGGSSSAPGAARSATATTASNAPPTSKANGGGKAEQRNSEVGQRAPSSEGAAPSTKDKQIQPDPSPTKLKHPPIELPTGKPERKPSKAQQRPVPKADISVSMPSGMGKDNICKGKDVSPELAWGAAPSDSAEIIVLAANMEPVDGKLHFDWAMAGIDPSLEGLKEGEIPKGAVLGRNGDGQNKYSLCPPESGSESYVFSVYAVSKSLSPKQGFDPLALRKAATPLAEDAGIFWATYENN